MVEFLCEKQDEFPDTYCEVVKQKDQFEYVSIGKWDMIGDSESAIEATEIANKMVELDQKPIYNNILFFHSGDIPEFFKGLNHEFTVHGHKFYTLSN